MARSAISPPNPSLTTFSGMVNSELDFTQDGAPSYELGAAVGGPLVDDKLGFRFSAWGRRDGGYIDRVDYQSLATTRRMPIVPIPTRYAAPSPGRRPPT